MRPPYIRIARVVKPFGTSGFFLIEATGVSSLSPVIPGLEVCIIPPLNNVPRWCPVEEIKHEGDTFAKMKLAGMETRSDAQALLGHELLVKETVEFHQVTQSGDSPTQEGQKYLPYASVDLIGLAVFDKKQGELGTIEGVSSNGAHALWEIVSDEQSFLFPAVEAYIEEIDHEKGEARIALPEGLLEAEAL